MIVSPYTNSFIMIVELMCVKFSWFVAMSHIFIFISFKHKWRKLHSMGHNILQLQLTCTLSCCSNGSTRWAKLAQPSQELHVIVYKLRMIFLCHLYKEIHSCQWDSIETQPNANHLIDHLELIINLCWKESNVKDNIGNLRC